MFKASKDLKLNYIKTFNYQLLLKILRLIIRLIPQGTVDDNSLGPDRFAGPKALDPYYCRQ